MIISFVNQDQISPPARFGDQAVGCLVLLLIYINKTRTNGLGDVLRYVNRSDKRRIRSMAGFGSLNPVFSRERMHAMRHYGVFLAGGLACLIASGCTCSRGPSLASLAGELRVVVPSEAGELLTRQASLTIESAAMEEHSEGVVRLRNVGASPLTISRQERTEGSQALELDDAVGQTMEPGAEHLLAVRFSPPGEADVSKLTVSHRAVFQVEVEGALEGESVATIELTANAIARDCHVPPSLDFGEVPIGQRISLPLVLENGRAGSASTIFSKAGAGADAFVIESVSPVEVAPGARLELPVTFAPLAQAQYQATVSIRRASSCNEGQLTLIGRGNDESMTVAPQAIDFGRAAIDVVVTRFVTISNRSRARLPIESLEVIGDAFSLAEPRPTEIAPQGTARVDVVFKPKTLGKLEGNLRFVLRTADQLPFVVPLQGFGGGPKIRLQPALALSFGSIPAPHLATARRVSVQNVGTPPSDASDTSNHLILGHKGRPPLVAIVPANPATRAEEFDVVVPSNFDALVGLPAKAGANAVDLDVRLTPSSLGLKEADLVVFSNDPQTPAVSLRLVANAEQTSPCTLSAKPLKLAVGDIPRGGSVDRTIEVSASQGPCLLSADIAPGSAPQLSVIDPPSSVTLQVGHARSVVVRAVADASLPFGTVGRGFVRIQGASAPVLIPVEMRIANCLVLNPAELDFGTTRTGCATVAKPINAYNACSLPIAVRSAALAPQDAPFRVISSSIPAQILSGTQPLTTLMAFAPKADGPASARMDFDIEEAGTSRTVSVSLKGQGSVDGVNTEEWLQSVKDKLDILFVVDNSGSMVDEQAELAKNFSAFIGSAVNANVDFQLGVTTTDTFLNGGGLVGTPAILTSATANLVQAFQRNVAVGTRGSGLEKPFEAMVRALTPPQSTGSNAGFLRADASLAVVIVTDAVEQSPNAVSVYLQALTEVKNNQKERFSVSVVGPIAHRAGCLLDSTVDGGRYQLMVKESGGVLADICTSDWSQDLRLLGEELVSKRTVFELLGTPATGGSISVTVNGVASSQWRYDSQRNAVVFVEGSAPPAKARIRATYVPACL